MGEETNILLNILKLLIVLKKNLIILSLYYKIKLLIQSMIQILVTLNVLKNLNLFLIKIFKII